MGGHQRQRRRRQTRRRQGHERGPTSPPALLLTHKTWADATPGLLGGQGPRLEHQRRRGGQPTQAGRPGRGVTGVVAWLGCKQGASARQWSGRGIKAGRRHLLPLRGTAAAALWRPSCSRSSRSHIPARVAAFRRASPQLVLLRQTGGFRQPRTPHKVSSTCGRSRSRAISPRRGPRLAPELPFPTAGRRPPPPPLPA